MSDTEKNSQESSIKVFGYRWIILLVYCAYTAVNFAQYLEYSIIANIISKYYGVSSIVVDLAGLLYPIVYLLGFVPCSLLIERYNLKWVSIIAAGLTTVGNIVKLLSLSEDRFYVVLIGQVLCALGQVIIVSIPSKVACTWFGPNEVSTACAIGASGTQIGVAIGCIVPAMMVSNSDSKEHIQDDLFIMLVTYATTSSVIFIITLLLFKARPDLPPSISQLNLIDNEDSTSKFWTSLKKLTTNKDVALLLLAFGISQGIWCAFGILFNKMYLTYFEGGEEDAGIIALITVISGGCFGSIIFGYILDKTHKFKTISFAVLSLAAVSFIGVLYILEIHSRVGSFIMIPLFGLFLGPGMVVSYEYMVEVTYPIAEEISCSAVNTVTFLCTLIFTFTGEALYDSVGMLKTNIGVDVVLFICSILIFFISSNLHRRDANLNIQQQQ